MTKSNWGMADKVWNKVTVPYIPSPEDIALLRRASPAECFAECPGGSQPVRVLVLGLTPALIDAPWQSQCEIHAVDFDEAMMKRDWKPRDRAQWHNANWNKMPFPSDYFDLVVGDCSFNALPSRDHYGAVLQEIVRVKRPLAPLIARFFLQSEPRLTLPDVVGAIAGSADDFGPAAKRLLILIAASRADGTVHPRDIPARIAAQWGKIEDYLAALGKSPAEIAHAVMTYESQVHLNFPNQTQIIEEFGHYFAGIEFQFPAYAAGNHCPTVIAR